MNLKKTSKILVAIAALFVVWQSLSMSGFCYAEMTYLPRKEVLDRYLHLRLADPNSDNEKTIGTKLVENYPDCCTVKLHPYNFSFFDIFINSLFNFAMFEIEIYEPQLGNDGSTHHLTIVSVDTCGYKVYDKKGTSITKLEYEAMTNKNHLVWRNNND